jgi:hypothetical protein
MPASTTQAGFYQLEFGPPINRREMYAVNLNTRESNLSKVSEEAIRNTLQLDTAIQYGTEFQSLDNETELVKTERGGLTRWLLCAVFFLLLVEQLMAWRFFPGLVLLCCCVCTALVWQAWSARSLTNGLVAVLGVVAFGVILLVVRQLRRP